MHAIYRTSVVLRMPNRWLCEASIKIVKSRELFGRADALAELVGAVGTGCKKEKKKTESERIGRSTVLNIGRVMVIC